MKKLLKSLSIAVLLGSLTACGGGGDSDSGSGSGGNDNGGVKNTMPKLTVSSTSISLKENETKSFTVKASDAEGDTLTYSVSASDPSLSAVYEAGNVKLTAGEVDQNVSATVIVKVSDGKLTATKTVNVTINNTDESRNESPEVSYGVISEIKEGETGSFMLNAVDPDGDELTYTVSSSNKNVLSGTYNKDEGLVYVTAGEVEEETMVELIVSVSDGSLEVKVSMNILVTNIADPTITSKDSVELQENASSTFTFKTEKENKVTVTSSDETVLKALYTGSSIALESLEVEEDKIVDLTIEATSPLGKKVSKMVSVLVMNIADGETINPKIDLVGADNDNVVATYAGENTIPVILQGSEDKVLTWSVKEFKGIDESDAVLDFVEVYEKRDDAFFVKFKSGVDRIVRFSLILEVSDGFKTYESEEFIVTLTARPNSNPLFFLEGNVNGGSLVPLGTTKTFKINILDDAPENVEILTENSRIWFNEGADFTYSIDPVAQTITVSSEETEVNKSFGVWVLYRDGETVEYIALRFTTSMVLTQLQKSTIDYIQEVNNKVSALKEYQEIARFYAEVAENRNLITEYEAKSYKLALKASDSSDYSILLSSLVSLEANVAIGTTEGQDAAWIQSMINLVEQRLLGATQTYSRSTYTTINELSNLTGGELPRVSYESALNAYDPLNKLFSHFKGNTVYGEYEGSEFVFFDEYKFLNAIVAKSEEKIEQAYKY